MKADRIEDAEERAGGRAPRPAAWRSRDDLVVVFADRISKVAAQVDFERQKESRVSGND